jgi:hypothetical protein
MAGLNNIISNTSQQTTTLPTWFDTAQQNVVSGAGSALAAAPQAQNTVAQNAVNALSGPTNAFTQAGGTLQSIASGAANPWITDSTGNVTPNTQTALGGLFQAQNQQLQQLAPNIMAPATAGGIGSGQFGSLRTNTAADKALTDAQSQLFSQQMQAALQNQATGVNAASGAGNVAQQNINNLLTTGQYQQAAPFTNISNYGKVIGGVQAPTTVSNQTQLSPLNQIAGLVQALGGQTGSTGILGSLGVSGGLTGLINSVKGAFGGGTSSAPTTGVAAGTYPLTGGGNLVINPDGSQYIKDSSGAVTQYYDASGNPVSQPAPIQQGPTPDGGNIDTNYGSGTTGIE